MKCLKRPIFSETSGEFWKLYVVMPLSTILLCSQFIQNLSLTELHITSQSQLFIFSLSKQSFCGPRERNGKRSPVAIPSSFTVPLIFHTDIFISQIRDDCMKQTLFHVCAIFLICLMRNLLSSHLIAV